jgi:hypothetical protein
MATTQNQSETLNFQPNNIRSLALSLGKRYQDSKKGWEIAKKVSEVSNNNFDHSNIEGIIDSIIKPQTKIKVVSIKIPKGETKNDKIRELLSNGKTVSEIAKELGLTYQRVKNVIKADRKKSENSKI